MSLPVFPPADFDSVIEAYAGGAAVNLPALVYFDFASAPMALWGGEYDLSSGGVTWKGIGKSGVLVAIDGIEDVANMEASEARIAVSGVDATVMAEFKDAARSDYVGRMLGVYAQFMDANWQVLAPPFAIYAGFMGSMPGSRTQNEQGQGTNSIVLPVSNLFYGRGNAPASFFTDRDQQIRHPGDLFFTFVSGLQETAVPVPWHR